MSQKRKVTVTSSALWPVMQSQVKPATEGLTCSSSKPKVLIPWQSSSKSSSDLTSLVFLELLAEEVTDMAAGCLLILLCLHTRTHYSPAPPLLCP